MMINISATGLSSSIEAFQEVKKKFDNRKEANARAVLVIDKWIQKNFQSEGKEVGGWSPLSPATLKQRKGKRILVRSGHLRMRWKHKYSNQYALITSEVSYGIYHDSDKPRRKLPRRQIAPDAVHVAPQLEKLFKFFTDAKIEEEFDD